MPAPDQKRIVGACIYAAVSQKAAAKKSKPVDEEDSENSYTVAASVEDKEVLWNELTPEEQNVFTSVAGFLHQFAGSRAFVTLDCSAAAEAVWNKFDVAWAATAVHVFKNVAQEFGHK